MPAITVRACRINRPVGDVANLRVSVDRSLASAGGPGAGVVATGAVTAQGQSTILPQITLYSTYNAPDLVTRGAQYRAELVDGGGAVVEVLPGFDAFMVLIPAPCTTWDELDESNDFYKQTPYQVQDDVPSTLMTDIDPELINSQWVCIGAQTDAAHDTIGLYFGKQVLPPGIRFSVCSQELQFSNDGVTWQQMGSGGGGFVPTSCNIGAAVVPGFPARLVGLDDSGCLVSFVPADDVPFWFATADSGAGVSVDFGDTLAFIADPLNRGIKTRTNIGAIHFGPDFDNLVAGTGAPSTFQLVATTTAQPDGARITLSQVVSGSVGNVLVIGADGGLFVPTAAGGSFTLAGDTGPAQTISSGDTMTLIGGDGISTATSPTDNLTITAALWLAGGLFFQGGGGAGEIGIKLDSITGGGNNIAQVGLNGLYVPPSAGSSFTLAGDSGTPQTINNGDTMTIAGGSGINSVAGATDTVTLDLDLAPSQSAGPNSLSFIANQVYGKPREYKIVRAVNASGALVPATDNVLVIDTSGGNVTITLATPAAGEFRDFHFKKQTTDANNVILTPASGQIDRAASYQFNGVIGTAGESRHVVFDGTDWWVL